MKIVLTGGPCGGKTTLLNAIAEEIPEAYCVPEVATMLLSGGFPAPTEQHPWSRVWQRNFQIAVAASQLALEGITSHRVDEVDKALIIFDRGFHDGAAYLDGGIDELSELTGLCGLPEYPYYDKVLHLTTSAIHNTYDMRSNPHRFEEAEAAIDLDNRIMQAWNHHHDRIILDEPDKSERIAKGLQIIRSFIE